MDLEALVNSLRKKIKANVRHRDYKHVTELASEYKAHISGVGLEERLRQFNLRESEDMFKQRKRLTEMLSKPLASSIKKPFYKISRNQSINKEIKIDNKQKLDAVLEMMSKFYGTDALNTKGLEFWLKNRFLELSFSDPNSFIVIEWEPKPLNEILEPKPFEVPSSAAVDFTLENGVVKSLTTVNQVIREFQIDNEKTEKKSVDKWTFYEEGYSINICEFCHKKFIKDGLKVEENQFMYKEGKKFFLATYNETKLNFIPAFRVGYLRDDATDGRTFVSPIDSALPYFRKLLKAVSELDLSITLHTFPQKLQFVRECQYKDKNQHCNDGILSQTGETCPNCNGTGLEVHKSGQDAIYFKMPDDPSDMYNIEQTIAYKSPPIDLIKFQDTYVKNLKKDAHLAVFNSTMFLATDPEFAKTATEIDFNAEGIHDTLFPYAEKFSEIWKTAVKVFIKLSGYEGDYGIKHSFPSDLKLKTTSMLVNELKTANESNAPSFLIDQLTSQLASQIYNNDDLSLKKYEVRHKFFPFNGKSKDEIVFLMTSTHVSESTKVLYANFEAIFTQIEKDYPNFYVKNYSDQWEILEKVIKEYEDVITKDSEITEFRFGFGQNEGGSETDPEGGSKSEPTDEDPKV